MSFEELHDYAYFSTKNYTVYARMFLKNDLLWIFVYDSD